MRRRPRSRAGGLAGTSVCTEVDSSQAARALWKAPTLVFNKEERKKNIFSFCFHPQPGRSDVALAPAPLDNNGIIFLRSHQMFPVVDFPVLE